MSPRLRRALAAAAAASITAFVPPASAAPSPPPDWAYIKVTPINGDVDFAFALRGHFKPTNLGPVVYGRTDPWALDGGPLVLDNLGGGPIAATTTAELGGLDVRPLRTSVAEGDFVASWGHQEVYGGPAGYLVFFTNSELSDLEIQVYWQRGTMETELITGSGSTVIQAVSRNAHGVGVDVVGAAAGSASTSLDVPSGIVGAFDTECNACTIDWSEPDGYVGHVERTGYPLRKNDHSFAGPSGNWEFSWTGVNVVELRNRVLMAYAPVGDAWDLFEYPGL